MLRYLLPIALSVLLPTAWAHAQSRDPVEPPAPADGRRVVRATRVSSPIQIDGRLDESAYDDVPSFTGLLQQEPSNGEPVSEQTEMWVLFDDENVYITCRCRDQHPERIAAYEMRRDSGNINKNDSFGVGIDTFHDQRNGYLFYVSAAGGMFDAALTNERNDNTDWNGVWEAKSGRFDQGWIAEIAIPFKTLRYKSGREQVWGLQIRRTIRSKNEHAYLTLVPPNWGPGAIVRPSSYATLVGLEAPASSLNLEVKPFAASRLETDRLARPAVRNDFQPKVGFDAKYGLSKSITADFTVNTDFAQVEADEAQANLTRFSLFFPEKREFFLEGKGIFSFGGNGSGGQSTNQAPTMFYSRRIGLSGSREVPLIAGGRVTGRSGPWTMGFMNIQTGEEASTGTTDTNFTVMRLRRNVLRRSNIGALFTRRSVSTIGAGDNRLYGADASLAFYQNVFFSSYIARTQTPGLHGQDYSYRGQAVYNADRYGLSVDHMVVQDNFNPEVGFMRREDFRRSSATARFSPRPMNSRVIRKYTYEGGFDYITDNHGHLESHEAKGSFQIDLQNSDSFSVEYLRLYEFLAAPFEIASDVRIPVGGYEFGNFAASYSGGVQRRLSGTATFETGSFYDGNKRTARLRSRVAVSSQFYLEPTASLNWIDLPEGSFTDRVIGSRATFTFTPRMYAAVLMQYTSSAATFSTNARFRWEYQPGSEFFLVFFEGRDTLSPHGSALQNRAFVVKLNKLVRW
jgi:hypothetical protein